MSVTCYHAIEQVGVRTLVIPQRRRKEYHHSLPPVSMMLVDPARLFSDAFDETLSLLGDVGRKGLYCYLERRYGIRREDIPMKFTDVSWILRGTLGVVADVLLRNIVERFSTKLKLEIPRSTEIDQAVEIVQEVLLRRVEFMPATLPTVPD